MSRVLCRKHGLTGGPHCCEHIFGAVMAGHDFREPVVRLDADLGDDAELVFDVVVCPACANASGLRAGDRISGAYFEANQPSHPKLTPTCYRCVDALLPPPSGRISQDSEATPASNPSYAEVIEQLLRDTRRRIWRTTRTWLGALFIAMIFFTTSPGLQQARIETNGRWYAPLALPANVPPWRLALSAVYFIVMIVSLMRIIAVVLGYYRFRAAHR